MTQFAIPSNPPDVAGIEPWSPIRLPLANFIALSAGELVARVFAFIVAAILTRRLGAAGFGELAFASAITSYLVLVPNLALQDLGSRAVALEPSAAAKITASVTRVRFAVGLGGAIAASVLALVLPSSPEVKLLVALSGLAAMPQALNPAWAYKALQRIRVVGASLVLAPVVCLIVVLAIVQRTDDLLWVPVAQAIGEVSAAALLLSLLVKGWRGGSFRDGVAVLRGAWAALVSRLLRAVIVTADMVLLGLLVDIGQVGLYSAAYRVCFLLTAIAASAHILFQPALMRAHQDPLAASSVLTDAVWMAWTIGLPLIAGGMIVAPDLLALLFGEPFRAAQDPFRILLFSIGMLFLHGAMNGAYLARHRLRLQTAVIGGAAALNLLLNAILIAPLGILGASMATAAAEMLILVASTIILWRWHWRPDFRVLFRPALAALGMSLVLVLLPGSWHVVIRIAGAGAVYIALLTLLGALPPQIGQSLQRAFTRV